MQGIAFTSLLVCLLLLVAVKRQYAGLVFLVGATFITQGQFFMVGPFHFYGFRILILAAIARILIRREFLELKITAIEKWLAVWAACGLVTALMHANPTDTLIGRLGELYNYLGVFFIFRCWLRDVRDLERLMAQTLLLAIPLGVCMLVEKLTTRNLFFVFGGVPEISAIRDGKLRAQGPFAHAILAGTVAASMLPMAVYLWSSHRRLAVAGIVSICAAVIACASSGPIMTLIFGALACGLWRYRRHLRHLIIASLVVVFLLALVMKAPVWYLIARIDIVGGSTGYHRAALIDAAYKHLPEWWAHGTDYTRHWMPTGVSWSEDHTDITNQYIRLGVHGGIVYMLLFIGVITACFRRLHRAYLSFDTDRQRRFLIWVLGGILFAHCATFISVSYFDQTIVFFVSLLAAITVAFQLSQRRQVADTVPAPVAHDALHYNGDMLLVSKTLNHRG